MNFVSTEDFNLIPFALPNIEKNRTSFDAYVTELQDEQLRKVFGTYFYDTMQAALDALPEEWETLTAYLTDVQVVYGNNIYKALIDIPATNTVPPDNDGINWVGVEEDNRWLLLKNGAPYTYYDRPYKWEGMTKAVKGLVYAYWIRDKYNDTLTESGNVEAKLENGTPISLAQRQVRGFNKFVDLIAGENVYRCYPYYNTGKDNLFGYLWSNEEMFADLFASELELPWLSLRNYLGMQFQVPQKWNSFNL